jgi:carboxyl-terminal processing protease
MAEIPGWVVAKRTNADNFDNINTGDLQNCVQSAEFSLTRSNESPPVPARNVLILFLVMVFSVACASRARHLLYGGRIGHAIQLIEDNYIDPIDPQDLFIAAMNGIVGDLDQFSEFIPPQRFQEFHSVIEQKFGGIGIQIEGPPAVDRLTVVTPIPNTPAFKAGVMAGDTILEINNRSTEGLTAIDSLKIMRGPIGTSVELLLERMDSAERVRVNLTRADIEVDSLFGDRIRGDSSWEYFLDEDPRIAYVRISLFGERTKEEFKSALESIANTAQALIIDLRFNPGGILPAAVELCDMLIDDGVIVRTKGRREFFDSAFLATPGARLDQSVPIVVLINGDSASASEIMAGCLQDLGRAKIAGSRSYGKGTVQQIFELESNRSAMKFTTARFLRPSYKNIHRTEGMTEEDDWGIRPDPELAMSLNETQKIYLNRRWLLRGDPRIMNDPERPPEPPFAADSQLEMVVNYLRTTLDGDDSRQSQPAFAGQPSDEVLDLENAAAQPKAVAQ